MFERMLVAVLVLGVLGFAGVLVVAQSESELLERKREVLGKVLVGGSSLDQLIELREVQARIDGVEVPVASAELRRQYELHGEIASIYELLAYLVRDREFAHAEQVASRVVAAACGEGSKGCTEHDKLWFEVQQLLVRAQVRSAALEEGDVGGFEARVEPLLSAAEATARRLPDDHQPGRWIPASIELQPAAFMVQWSRAWALRSVDPESSARAFEHAIDMCRSYAGEHFCDRKLYELNVVAPAPLRPEYEYPFPEN